MNFPQKQRIIFLVVVFILAVIFQFVFLPRYFAKKNLNLEKNSPISVVIKANCAGEVIEIGQNYFKVAVLAKQENENQEVVKVLINEQTKFQKLSLPQVISPQTAMSQILEKKDSQFENLKTGDNVSVIGEKVNATTPEIVAKLVQISFQK